MKKQNKLSRIISKKLETEEKKTKYLIYLNERIIENRKSIRKLIWIMLLTSVAFPLVLETKITVISLGPFKVIDKEVVLGTLPIIFSFSYYKYLMIWFSLVEQKITYKLITANIFNLGINSYLNIRIKHFSIFDSLDYHNPKDIKKHKLSGCMSMIIWFPTLLFLLLSPFFINSYLVYKLFYLFEQKSFLDWFLIIFPLIILVFKILTVIGVIRKQKEDSRLLEKEYLR